MVAILLGFVLLGAFILFVSQAVRLEIVCLSIVAFLALTGILNPSEALSGFANPATITVAAMLILSAGLTRVGVVDYVGATLEKRSGGGRLKLLVGLGLMSSVFSAFMNNTAIVAIMVPVALVLSRRSGIAPSKLLLPISYLAILGGTCTLIGTSTNILVDSLYRGAGGAGFGMFEFTSMGIFYLGIGGAYVLIFSRRLPDRTSFSLLLSSEARSQFVTEVTIPEGSPHAGKSIREVFPGPEEAVLLELIRDEEATLRPGPELLIREGDTFLLETSARVVSNLFENEGIRRGTAVADDRRVTISRFDLQIVEAVITPNSSFIRQKVKEIGLSRRHSVYVLAIRSLGKGHHVYKLRDHSLRSGDVLLVQGERASLRALQESGDVLLIEGVEKTLTFPRKAPIALGILASVVLFAAFGVAPIVFLAIGGVALMLLTRCLTMAEATRSLDSSVLLLLAGTIPLGLAMDKTGLAGMIASRVVDLTADYGPLVLISCFYLLTSLLTEVISNNAAAVVLTPIALGIAGETGINPKTILMAIAFGASASFATPIGYQTNTLVMGPGGYFFRDYLKFGLPMNVLMWIVATILLPIFWPL